MYVGNNDLIFSYFFRISKLYSRDKNLSKNRHTQKKFRNYFFYVFLRLGSRWSNIFLIIFLCKLPVHRSPTHQRRILETFFCTKKMETSKKNFIFFDLKWNKFVKITLFGLRLFVFLCRKKNFWNFFLFDRDCPLSAAFIY